MKVVADRNIPCVEQAFADFGEVELIPGRDIRAHHLRDCRCLVTRTVTRVDADLLDGSAVEFVGTATIGTDHLDLDYLDRAGIACSNAAGCNAESAAEYVVSGLFALSRQRDFDPFRLKAGIVGCGNVGSNLVEKLRILGIEHRVCDPPLQALGDSRHDYQSLDTLLDECDFISLHVPLTRDGDHPTFHLLDSARLHRLKRGCVLVNAARGEVVDNAALLALLDQRDDLCLFLDTWENEPLISRDLLRRVDLASPHIAGYSVEGRLRGTQMVLDAASRHFGVSPGWNMNELLPEPRELDVRDMGSGLAFWRGLMARHCDPGRDHMALLEAIDRGDNDFRSHFDSLRRVYPDRLEYPRWRLRVDPARQPVSLLEQLGFKLA